MQTLGKGETECSGKRYQEGGGKNTCIFPLSERKAIGLINLGPACNGPCGFCIEPRLK